MLSTTTEDESDDCHYKARRKQCRQKVLQSSSSDSDDSIIARPRRKKCRVAASSSSSDDSILTRPSRKKCKVLSQTESSSASSSSASDSENEDSLRRWSDKRPKKRTITTDSDPSSCEETSPAKRPTSAAAASTTTATTTTTTATTVQADANSSDSDEGERCIICFKTLRPPFAHPSNCSHNFHPVCLATWSKTSNTCPIDRVKYTAIITVDSKGDIVSREEVSTPPPQDHNADFEPDDATFCEICSQHDREHEMLLCDRCEAGYHLNCLTPPLREVPEGNWYCPRCEDLGLELRDEMNVLMSDAAVILESRMRRRQQASVRMPRGPRTSGAQRVFNIIHRQAIRQPSTSSAVTISRQRTSSSRRSRRSSTRRPQSTRYKVELITVEDGTTLEVKVAVNTRTRTKTKKHSSKRRSKKKCSKSSRRSGESSRSYDNSFAGEGSSRSLDLFGSRPTLEYFSGCEAEDELDEDRGGEMAVLRRAARTGPRNMASRKQIAAQILNSNQRRVAPRIEASSAPVDLVSSIMEQQEKWHSPNASYESTSNGNIRVILKDKVGRSRHVGGSGAGSSGTSSAQPSASSSRSDRPSNRPSTSGTHEGGSSSMSQSSSRSRGGDVDSARGHSPNSDSPHRPPSPAEIEPEQRQKEDAEQPSDKDEKRISFPCSPSQSETGDNDPASHSTSESLSQAPLDSGTSKSGQSAPHDAASESPCLWDSVPLDSGAASPQHGSKNDDTEEKVNMAEETDEDHGLEKQGSPDKTCPDEKAVPSESEFQEEAMPIEPPALLDPEEKCAPDKPPKSPDGHMILHSLSVPIDHGAESDHNEQPEPLSIEKSAVGESTISPDPDARSDLSLPISPNTGLQSLPTKPPESPDVGVEGPGERTRSPQSIESNDSENLSLIQETKLSNSTSAEAERKDGDDQEAHSPFPCLENVEDCLPPRLSSQGFQEQREFQEDDRLSDGSSCDGDGRRSARRNFDEITHAPGDDNRPSSARPAVTSRRMSNCSDLSDDSDNDQYSIKKDPKIQSSDREDSDGEPSSVRHGQMYGQPYSPEMKEQQRYSQQDDRLQTCLGLNGLQAISPNEEISNDSTNFNSSAERLGEDLGGINRSEEEKDGLVEITDEEISNYEKKWEMEKKLVENTELEGLEAISDVESPGHKSAKSDDGENSGLERLEDGLETISDLEAEGPKTDGLETISDLEVEGIKSEKQEEEVEEEDTPMHQPCVPDDTPDDTQNEEEGEIRDDEAPVPWKKINNITKERSYRGMKEAGKEIIKEIVSKERDRRVELDRHDSRISSSDRGRKKRDDSSSTSSSESRSRGEKERSISRVKRKRSMSRTRSGDRDRTRSRDRARDRSRSRDRLRIRSRDRGRDRSIDRTKDRSRSRISRDGYRRDRSRDRKSRSRDRKRRRTRSPRKDRSRSRDRSRRSRDRKRSKRSPSVSSSSDCSTCSCSSCEKEETQRRKRKDRRDSKDRDRSKDKEKSKRDISPRSKKRRTPGPSKEVFTSGDNILVSVNFKKDGEGNKAKEAPPAERKREKKKDEKERSRKDRKESKENKPVKRKDSPKKPRKKKKIDTSNMKTVAIIDLDTSPFRVTTPTTELIILTDSDEEDKTSKVDPRMGPRTPPEPQMKFTLATKKQQVRNMANPLLTMERDVAREDDLSHAHRGPNTPPEPEIRSPYDPFEPTKSPTPDDARGRQSPNQEPNQQVPQVSLTPPRARPQHVAPATPSPLHSPPSTVEHQDRPKLMPFQPVPVDSGDDSPGGGGGGDSPYSPGSSEGDDLFEPPQQLPPPKQKPRVPLPLPLREHPSKHAAPPPKNRPSSTQRDVQKGSGKKEGGIKIDENQQKLLDDLPNSAVEMQFIEKLHRQERVVEEVKLILKPHYAKKHVNKDEYKEILRRAVPKICHSRTGEINPMKIQKLVDAYVQRFRHKKKLAAGGGNPVPNPIPPLRQNKPVVIK